MGTETRRTTQSTTIRLTPDDHAVLAAAAEAAGVGPSTFARIATLDAAGGRRPEIRKRPDPVRRDLAQVLGALGRIGNNVNQVARVANATGDVSSILAVHGLRDQLAELTQAVLELRP